MRAHSREPLPEDASLLRQWKRWETGEHVPSDFYQPLIAVTFGTVTHAIFPVEGRREANAELLSATGMDTLELVHRLQTSDADDSTIDGLRIVTDRLCSEYPYLPRDQLLVEGPELASALDDLPRSAADSGAAPGDPGARRAGWRCSSAASSTTPVDATMPRPPGGPRCHLAPRPIMPRSVPGRTRCAPGWL